MTTIHVQLDDETYGRIKRLAASQGKSIEEVAAERLADAGQASPPTEDPILGMFADAPDLVDEVLEEAMRTRERPWRLP